MSLDQGHSRSQSGQTVRSAPDEALGSLKGCLVEGDAEQLARERRVRRKALAISVAFQVAVLAALVLLPVFSTAERIALGVVTPMPPYPGAAHPSPKYSSPRVRDTIDQTARKCFLCPPTVIPLTIPTDDPQGPQIGEIGPASSNSEGPHIPGLDRFFNSDSNRPRPPVETKPPVHTNQRFFEPMIALAMLLHRVEPVYPPLARQIHREGRVELRAIISTDGTIQSLEVVGGDPMFFPSALDAVRQWRYRPTILNGVPVEVETHITVIYTLQH